MTRARRTLFAAGAALGLIGASAVVRSSPIVIWNASASVPIGFYILTPIGMPKVGELVAARARRRRSSTTTTSAAARRS